MVKRPRPLSLELHFAKYIRASRGFPTRDTEFSFRQAYAELPTTHPNPSISLLQIALQWPWTGRDMAITRDRQWKTLTMKRRTSTPSRIT
jgi:hypothetical protein